MSHSNGLLIQSIELRDLIAIQSAAAHPAAFQACRTGAVMRKNF